MHLLPTKIFYQCRVVNPRSALQISTEESCEQAERSYQVWFIENSLGALRQHEDGMVTRHVVRMTVLYPIGPSAVGAAGGSMVN